jgi:hypothetical protein
MEKTQIPEMIAEDFENMLQKFLAFQEAMKAMATACIAFAKDLEQLAKVVAEIKTNKRLKVREGK